MARSLPKVTMYSRRVKEVTEAHYKAAIKTADKMRTEIIKDRVIPFREGTLQNIYTDVYTADAKLGRVSIEHDGPYAQRLYYNPQFNFGKAFNPNAKGEWWAEYLTGNKKNFAREIFSYYYKKEAGI